MVQLPASLLLSSYAGGRMWRCGRIELYYEVIGREGWSVLISAAKAFSIEETGVGTGRTQGAGMRKSGEDIPNSRDSTLEALSLGCV